MRIVIFGIHPDDIELGCGGTAAVCAHRGDRVVLVDLTRGEMSSNGTPDIRAAEAAEAGQILGCEERVNLHLPDGGIHSEDPEQQRRVARVIREVRPDVAVIPSADDPHPDHASGGALVLRSLYLSGIHGYDAGVGSSAGVSDTDGRVGGEPGWKTGTLLVYAGRRDISADFVVDITGVFSVKMAAIRAHRSQFEATGSVRSTPLNRPAYLDSIEARAITAGQSVGTRYGEAFKTLAPVGLCDLSLFDPA